MFTKSHQHHIDKVFHLKSKLGSLYIHLVSQAFALSMISVFIPIYLLELGYTLQFVFTFILVQWTTFSLLPALAGWAVQHIGVKEVILIRTPILIVTFLALSYIEKIGFLQGHGLFILAFLLGATGIFYTISIASLFAEMFSKKSAALETTKLMSFPRIGIIFGPIIGGFLSLQFGFPVLFVIVSILMFLSVLPLFKLDHRLDHPKFSFKEVIRLFKKEKKMTFYINLYGMRAQLMFVVLPIAIYLVSQNVGTLGSIMSLVSFLSVIAAFKMGKYVDAHGRSQFMILGATITSFFFALVGLLVSSGILLYLALLSGFIAMIFAVPFESLLFEYANEAECKVSYLIFREYSYLIGRVLLLFLMIVFSTQLEVGYLLMSFLILLFILF